MGDLGASSFNNRRFFLSIWSVAVVFLLLAGRGGEGEEKDRVVPRGAGGRWGSQFELQVGEYYMVALFVTVICDRCGGLSKRRGTAFLQPPVWRPFTQILVGIQHLRVSKWFVPGGVKVAGGGVSELVERTKDLIAFLIFVLGSSVQLFRTVVYLLIFLSVLYVKCNPPTMI